MIDIFLQMETGFCNDFSHLDTFCTHESFIRPQTYRWRQVFATIFANLTKAVSPALNLTPFVYNEGFRRPRTCSTSGHNDLFQV